MAEIKKRIKKNGKISYTASIRIKGAKSISKTHESLTILKRWISDNESEIRKNGMVKDREARKHTLSALVDRYIKYELCHRKSDLKKYETMLLWWKNEIGHYRLSDITPSLLSECKDKLSKEPSLKPQKGRTIRSNATVNRYMACLSVVLTKASREWEWMEENPMFKVAKKKEPKGRVRFLSNDEKNILLAECKKISYELYLATLIALCVGARYGEIVGLKWQHIDFENRMFHFMDTKNGENRGVPIPSIVLKELQEFSKVRNIKSDYIFTTSNGKQVKFLRGIFVDAVEAAKIQDFRFHDLRHTAASYLAMNGASLLDIAEILGHKTLAMVKRYSHLTKKHTADLLERMNEKQFSEAL